MYILWIAKGCGTMKILKCVGIIILAIGVTLIYDARPIAKKDLVLETKTKLQKD